MTPRKMTTGSISGSTATPILRGGAWFENAATSICEIRYFCDPELRIRGIGFRIVRTE